MSTLPDVLDNEPVNVQHFDHRWLPDLMSWFPDAYRCRSWAGPQFRFPFNEATFREDLRVDDITSLGLMFAGGSLGAFGQYYLRLGRCHLARLVVAPTLRGRRIGGTLIRELCDRGCEELGTDSCSLFVLAANASERQLYGRLGFAEAPYPEPASMLEGSLFMVATRDQLAHNRADRRTP
jgi:ribosomal protein S18 acetylase RimI-like enzyme